jgi:hypothetical protein
VEALLESVPAGADVAGEAVEVRGTSLVQPGSDLCADGIGGSSEIEGYDLDCAELVEQNSGESRFDGRILM